MTKQQFHEHVSKHGCSSHYQGNTRTMFVFGSLTNLRQATRPDIKSGQQYAVYSNPMGGILRYNVSVQATSTT